MGDLQYGTAGFRKLAIAGQCAGIRACHTIARENRLRYWIWLRRDAIEVAQPQALRAGRWRRLFAVTAVTAGDRPRQYP